MAKVSFYLLGCVSTIVCRDVPPVSRSPHPRPTLPHRPRPSPRLQLCVLVSRLRLGLCLCVALALALASSSSSSWSCLLAPPFADTTCFILVLETLCSLLFLPTLPLPIPLCQSFVARLSLYLSLSFSVSLSRCLRLVYL